MDAWTAEDRKRITDRRYRKTRALKIIRGEPTGLVDATKAARHIAVMADAGWSYCALEQIIRGAVTDVTLKNVATGIHATIERRTAAAALSLPHTLRPTDDVADTAMVPTTSAQRRVHALLRLGWTHADMRPLAGTDTTHLARGTYTQMTAERWRKIDRLYDELSMKVGPSLTTASRARAAGHAPPLAWGDSIDIINARPVGHSRRTGAAGDVDQVVVERLLAGDRVPSSRAEKVEATRRWVESGKSVRSFARLHGWNDNRYVQRGDDEGAA